MKKYGISEGITGRHIGKVNSKGDQRLDKESLSDNDVMQLFEAMGRYIAKITKTPADEFTVISSEGGEKTIGFKVYN